MKEICLCVRNGDRFSYFEPNDVVHPFHKDTDYGLLLTLAGVFTSVKAAWDRGYKGKVPFGWNDVKIDDFHIWIVNNW